MAQEAENVSFVHGQFLFYTLYCISRGRMIGIAEDSVRFAHSGPSHNLLRPAIAELVSCGPLPLPVSGGWTRLRNPYHPPD